MRNPLTMTRWSPYAAGAGIGVLSWATFLFMNKALGTSTTMVNAAGLAECLVAPEHVRGNSYLAKQVVAGNAIDWQFALVVFLAVGAFLSARLSRQKFVEHVPEIWKRRFGPSKALRYSVAFVGGLVMIIGARLANGCTSGHGISGGLQFAVSSWTFFVAMFASGVAAAFLLYGVKAGKGV